MTTAIAITLAGRWQEFPLSLRAICIAEDPLDLTGDKLQLAVAAREELDEKTPIGRATGREV